MKNTPILNNLARDITQRDQSITEFLGKAKECAGELAKEAILLGSDIIKAKAELDGADVWHWLGICCPKVNQDRAQKCTKYARNSEQLTNPGQLLLTLSTEAEPKQPPERKWPDWYNTVSAAARWVRNYERSGFPSWPAERQQTLKEKILPVVKQLWPERFE